MCRVFVLKVIVVLARESGRIDFWSCYLLVNYWPIGSTQGLIVPSGFLGPRSPDVVRSFFWRAHDARRSLRNARCNSTLAR